MSNKLPLALILPLVLGGMGSMMPDTPAGIRDASIEDYLRRKKRTVAEEYERIKQRKSVLSRNQQYRIEQHMKQMERLNPKGEYITID
jgi:membrane protein involved in colicin uptake